MKIKIHASIICHRHCRLKINVCFLLHSIAYPILHIIEGLLVNALKLLKAHPSSKIVCIKFHLSPHASMQCNFKKVNKPNHNKKTYQRLLGSSCCCQSEACHTMSDRSEWQFEQLCSKLDAAGGHPQASAGPRKNVASSSSCSRCESRTGHL